MSDTADLDRKLQSIEDQLRATRKQERKAAKVSKKLSKHQERDRQRVQEEYSGYDEVVELEVQALRQVDETLGRASSEHIRLTSEVGRLESERKQLRKAIRKAERAQAKADKLAEREAEKGAQEGSAEPTRE